MGHGIDMARAEAPEHAELMDNMKDQLLIVLFKRLADANGRVAIPVAEIDATGGDLLAMRVDAEQRTFHFQLRKKS